MGWFGYGPMDGDDAMDLQDTVFDMIGVNEKDSNEKIKILLETKQDTIYDWLRDYDWNKNHSYNPGFIQSVYIQALGYIMCEYNVKINERGIPVFIDFIKNDVWATKKNERKKEMNKLLKKIINNEKKNG